MVMGIDPTIYTQVIGGNHMDTTTQAFISDLISQNIIYNWTYWVMFFLVSAPSIIASSFLVAYARKRGENAATKEDLDSLKEQLQITTSLTERIKSEVGHIEWRTREEFTSRRAKIEEFVQQIGTVASTMEQSSSVPDTQIPIVPVNTECINRLDMLARLYFPELISLTVDFNLIWRKVISNKTDAQATIFKLNKADVNALNIEYRKFLDNHNMLYKEALEKRRALEEAVVIRMGNVLRFSDEQE